MTAKFKIELNDLIAVQTFLVTKSKFHKRNKLIGSIVAVILLIIVNMTIFKANLITMVIVSSVLFFVTYNFIYKKAMIDQTKRIVKNDPSLLNVECTLNISEDGLFRDLRNATNKLEWSEIKIVSEDDERYILYISDVHAIVIKKKPHNKSEEEILKYNQLLHNYFNQHNIVIE